jgi:hypothetical protein
LRFIRRTTPRAQADKALRIDTPLNNKPKKIPTYPSNIDVNMEKRLAEHVMNEIMPFNKNNMPATIKAALGDFFASFII